MGNKVLILAFLTLLLMGALIVGTVIWAVLSLAM
jgi:hypothetical protein